LFFYYRYLGPRIKDAGVGLARVRACAGLRRKAGYYPLAGLACIGCADLRSGLGRGFLA